MKIDQLFESFDAPYQYWKITKNSYLFDTDDGYEYDVLFHGEGSEKEPLEVMFVIIDKQSRLPMRKYDSRLMANSSQPLRVLATVFAIAEEYVRKHQPDVITFSGEKKLGMVYDRIISKRFQNSGYTIKRSMVGNSVMFALFKDKK